jgi:DNA-binding CsgD family transcriptional regulator
MAISTVSKALPLSSERAEARIRQLCSLGLGGQIIMPALLEELHALVPSYANAFFWSDEKYRITNLYFENPCTVAWLYSNDLFNRRTSRKANEFERLENGSRQVRRVEVSASISLNLDDRIYRPLENFTFVRVPVRDENRLLGVLQLCRLKGKEKFDVRAQNRLAKLAPMIARGLAPPEDLQPPLANSEERGLLIVDPDGRLRLASPLARKLLFLAAYPRISPKTVPRTTGASAVPEVAELCRKLASAFADRDEAIPSPIWQHRNRWGSFIFRAYWLDDGNFSSTQVGITAQFQEPMAIKLWRRLEALPLSRRQMQLCLLMGSGRTYSAIAEHLGIAESTVVDHSRRLYDKLGVHNRTELMNKLLTL